MQRKKRKREKERAGARNGSGSGLGLSMPEVQRVGRGGETAETEKRETDYSAEQVKWQWIEESQEEEREKKEGTPKESVTDRDSSGSGNVGSEFLLSCISIENDYELRGTAATPELSVCVSAGWQWCTTTSELCSRSESSG